MKECTQASESLKVHLASALALRLPNLLKPSQLYIHERQGFSLGVLTQMLSDILQPIVYLSNKLDHIAKRWPACLRAAAATCELL